MNRKRIMPGIILLLLGIVGTYLFFESKDASSTSVTSTIESVTSRVNNLPEMIIYFQDGNQLNIRTLEGRIVLVLYQPDCDHCQREAAAIHQNIQAFNEYEIYFITDQSFDKIAMFGETQRLNIQKNVFFGRTEVQSILDNFGQISTPSVYIYLDRKLKASFNGETTIEAILNQL